MKVLICGGRNFESRIMMMRVMDQVHANRGPIKQVIHGGARGADRLGGEWAREQGINVRIYKADWDRDKKAAGPIRNMKMLTEGQPDLVVAFPGGDGTAHMVSIARKAGVEVICAS